MSNLYEDPMFFEIYAQFDRSKNGLAGAPEWPVVDQMLPSLKDTNVLDLGCGYDWLCRKARERGAKSVLVIDVSERMLERAREMTEDVSIRYERADLEEDVLAAASYDFVYCSLVLHYILDFEKLAKKIANSLKKYSYFNFSIEHPVFTAPVDPYCIDSVSGHRIYPINDYPNEGKRITNWIVKDVRKQHRTLSTYINTLVDAGLSMKRLAEWWPASHQVEAMPFLIASFVKQNG